MSRLHISLWGGLFALTVLWVAIDPIAYQFTAFFPFRAGMVQYTGLLGMVCMSVIMILALRPRWLESWFDGLDKIYRFHKWLGITALVLSVIHWLWAKGPKWAVGWGWLERPQRGPRPQIDGMIEKAFSSMRGLAEDVGEWAFYGAVAMMVLALIKWFPYRWFFKTHRILAITYLVLVFHAVVLLKFSYWMTPIGLLMAPLLASGTYSAVIVLLRKVAASRKVEGTITALRPHHSSNSLEVEVEVPSSWPGHQAGQFAFATSNPAEGPHPYTIASAWNPSSPRLTFMVKALGDHTTRLPTTLSIGQSVTIEGPYGRFTFQDKANRQIWVSGGIGITPFLARLQQLAGQTGPRAEVDYFHCAAQDDSALHETLRAAANAAGVRLHLILTPRDGRLDTAKIQASVPDWNAASIWFCGPAGFGQSLKRSFAASGLAPHRFHQELFEMR